MNAYSQITFDFTEKNENNPAPSVGIRLKSIKKKEEPESEPIESVEPHSGIMELTDNSTEYITEINEEVIDRDAEEVQPVLKSTRGRKSLKTFAADADMISIPSDDILFQKRYYSIGEVSTMFRVNASLLRFWESEFDIIQPKKNKKGDRHFRPVDIKNLQLIYDLLRRRKLTIEGAREFLKKNKKSQERFEAIQSLQKIRSYLLELKAGLNQF